MKTWSWGSFLKRIAYSVQNLLVHRTMLFMLLIFLYAMSTVSSFSPCILLYLKSSYIHSIIFIPRFALQNGIHMDKLQLISKKYQIVKQQNSDYQKYVKF